jgi:hypothetical protein
VLGQNAPSAGAALNLLFTPALPARRIRIEIFEFVVHVLIVDGRPSALTKKVQQALGLEIAQGLIEGFFREAVER